ncbi:hypothetical protein XELAEV_18043276mg [Xenopus laevis]|uniref:Uncharacterized protein n=1 Tax=Xenopus laevis TaxID=8355 RepID=A0A974H2A7_XENLA|nr:hypothetical protein XELAEV_18043276mg [Xenopus laevis]
MKRAGMIYELAVAAVQGSTGICNIYLWTEMHPGHTRQFHDCWGITHVCFKHPITKYDNNAQLYCSN